MQDAVLKEAYGISQNILLRIKESKELIAGISLIDGNPQMRFLPVDILLKYKLITSSVPDNFPNSIVTITEDGIIACNMGIEKYVERETKRKETAFMLTDFQYWAAKYWWLILILTAVVTGVITIVLNNIL